MLAGKEGLVWYSFTLDYINRRSIVNPLRAVMHVLVSTCHQSGEFLECGRQKLDVCERNVVALYSSRSSILVGDLPATRVRMIDFAGVHGLGGD